MKQRMIWLLPVLALLLVSSYGFLRGTTGMWHSQNVDFWQKQKWHELKALAANLDRTNRADAETLYLAAHASWILQDPSSTAYFASRFLEQRSLNWNWELWFSKNYQPDKLQERLRLYRTRGTTIIFATLTFINLLFLWKNWNVFPWSSAISILGIILLIL